MSRLKLLAAAMLLALPIISACGEDPPLPPPTGSIDGLVSIEGQGVDGISVNLSNGATATTANGGMYRFDGVEAGAYTVTISNYPDDASFNQTSAAATIATDGENVTVNFPGTWIRTSAIMGTVTVENEGLGGVTVKLIGLSDSETLTDGSGQYAFTGLRAGNYTVEISGFDEDDVAFGSTASTASVAVGESKVVTFEGTYLRTAAITGQVTVAGNPLADVTVSMQGRGEDRTATTNGAGQFTFSELRSGDYSVGITNPNAEEYSFEVTSQTVTVAHGETASVPFEGILLRTASIMGTVTVEGTGLGDVSVTITGGPNGEEFDAMTNAAGQYSVTNLRAGDYSVGISGFDDDLYGFEVTTSTVTVELEQTATVPFEGIMLRTAGIAGTVTIEGHPLSGVTVTVSGGPKDEEYTQVTDEAGFYMVDELHAGDYAVAISDFDANEYEFEATTQTISVGLRETATVAFQGELLRTAGISGRVSVEGAGLDGIEVTLSGDADMMAETADGGQYAFAGLAAGDYMVAIAGWDSAAYTFDMTEAELEVADDASVIQNFDGMHTRTASVSGMLFLDEINNDKMHNEGEPAFAFPGVPLLLQGPGVNDVQFGMSMADGSYAFEGLTAGSYRVLINMDAEGLADSLTAHGFAFAGELTGQVVNVEAAMAATVNFPFRIVMQTIVAGAVMGKDTVTGYPVGNVELVMYANAEDADAGMSPLGTATTDSTGMAMFHFPRAMDTGAGGHGNDHLVFVKVTKTGHKDLVVSDDGHIEIEYASTDRISHAPTAAKVLNQGVNFQWWVKSDEDAKDGNEFLEGWKVIMGDTVMADTIITGADGKATYSGTVELGAKPAEITIMLDTLAQDDTLTMGEKWTQSKALTYTHNPLALPAMNTAEMNDLGPIYVTYTTQRLVLGVYREADDRDGFTDYRSGLPRGDHRPHATTAKEMSIQLLTRDERNRLRQYDWDPHPITGENRKKGMATVGANGLVTFTGIPAGAELTVRFHVGSSARKQVDYGYDEIETFGDDLDHGVTVGAFGDMAGAGPEVRMCSASDDTNPDAAKDEWCATFGYQWMTGQLGGNVGNQRGHKVDLDPETGHGATDDDTRTGAGGAYRFAGLQDGEYSATASDQGDYTVDGAPTKKGIAVYHDEFADNKDEDKADSAWAGRRAQVRASWTTTKGGLGVWGYVANDDDGNNLVRGNEGMAGLQVKLLTDVRFWTTATGGAIRAGTIRSSKTADSTMTAANGLYAFNGLNNKTKYWVQVVAGGDAAGYRNVASKEPNLAGGSGGLNAQTYPALPEESTYRKPAWNRASGTARNTSVSYTVGTGLAAQTATLHNFGLVYTDGTVAGRVNNASGSNANIDVRIISSLDADDFWERATSRSGEFSVANLMEGNYTAEIEDAGYGVPCLNAAGTAADDDNVDANGDCNNPAATTLSGSVEGRDDYQSLGTLHVYNMRMGDDDNLTSLTVVQTVGGKADTIGHATSISQDADGSTTVADVDGLTIAYATARVRVVAETVDEDASARAMLGRLACGGNSCTLPYHATGGATNAAGDAARTSTIAVMVTAENGYDDHAYTFSVSRTNPVDNVLERGEILNQAGRQAGGSGGDGQTAGNPWQVTTAGADSTAITLTFDLEEVGTGDDAICGQSISVKINGGEAQDSVAAGDRDACAGEQYRLSAGTNGTVYEITITSQDGVAKKHYINLAKGSDEPENQNPTVTTAIPAQTVGVGATQDVDLSNYFSDADNDDLSYSAMSDATDTATVAVSGSMLTITGVAEGGATISVTADDGNGGMATTSFGVTVEAAEENQDPTVTAIPAQTVAVGATRDVDLSGYFSDPDNDDLTYTAMSDATDSATVAVNGSILTITGVAEGSAGISVTADDGNGGMATTSFGVTVEAAEENQDPTVTAIPAQAVAVDSTQDVDLSNYFSDPDNDELSYTAVSSATDTATAAVSGSMLTITGVAEGSAEITVTANDGNGGTVDGTIAVTVSTVVQNQDPTVAAPIADQMVEAGATVDVDVAANFSDPDNDDLTFTATSSAEAMATAAVNESVVTITGVAEGSAEITVTADDGNGGMVSDTFDVTVNPTSPAVLVSISEATVRENSEMDYTVRLATAPTDGSVTVAIAVAAATGETGSVAHVTTTRSSLTFDENNWNRAQTVTILVGNDENEVSEVADVTHTPTGTGNYATVDNAVITVTADDDDVVAGAAIEVDMTSHDVDEGDTVDVMVSLSAEPTGDVTVAATLDPAANVAEIQAGASLTFTMENWDSAQAVAIIGSQDNDPVDAMATLTLAASGGGYGGAEDVEVEVNVIDDEEATISVDDGLTGAQVLEGGTLQYNVTLSAPPPAGQVVHVNLSVNGPASVSPTQASFDNTTSNNQIQITVTANSDSDSNDESVMVSHTVDASDSSGYGSATAPSDISVTVKDDEAHGVVVSRTALSVVEGGMASYTVRLTRAPSTDETVTIHLAGTGVNLNTASLTFGAGDFDTEQTVTVTGHVDGNDQNDSGMVVHTVSTSGGDEDYDGVTASTVNITVTEPDSG